MYILRNDYHNKVSWYGHNSAFEGKLKCFSFSFSWSHNVMQNMWNALVLRKSVTKKRTETLQSCHVRSQNPFALVECISIFFTGYYVSHKEAGEGGYYAQDSKGWVSASKTLHLWDMKCSFSSTLNSRIRCLLPYLN